MEKSPPKKFLKLVLKHILQHPKDLVVTSEDTEEGIKLIVDVNDKDIPDVIGTEGSTAEALRKLMGLYGYKLKKNIAVRFKFDL